MKKRQMMLVIAAALALMSILGGGIAACATDNSESHTEAPESGERERSEDSGEHGGSEEGSEEGGGEEARNLLTKEQTFDQVRAGARLILRYDDDANAFTGTVENTTNATLSNVRVEVHLSNGIELGPTTPVDLAPGQMISVTLPASAQPFDTWNPHAEVGPQGTEEGHGSNGSEGSGEHSEGSEGEGSGEHSGGGSEGSGEHSTGDGPAAMTG